jgi:hypothetical protein
MHRLPAVGAISDGVLQQADKTVKTKPVLRSQQKTSSAIHSQRFSQPRGAAHSSQSGEAAAEMKGVLAGHAIAEQAKEEAEEKALPDYEEEILKAVAKRGRSRISASLPSPRPRSTRP